MLGPSEHAQCDFERLFQFVSDNTLVARVFAVRGCYNIGSSSFPGVDVEWQGDVC